MKRVVVAMVGILLTLPGIAQVGSPIYYNDYWKITTRSEAVYFRKGVLDTAHLVFAGAVKDYFRNGQLQMTGNYEAGMRDGPFVFYYSNGQTELEGKYDLGQRIGEWRYYYADGSLKQKVEFSEGDFLVWEYYDSLGNALVENGTGLWQHSYFETSNPERIIIEGKFVNGKKDGKWKCRNESGRLYYVETFKEGKFIKGKAVNAIGQRSGKYEEAINNKLLPPYKLSITEQFIFAGEEVQDQYPHLAKVATSEKAGGTIIDVQPIYQGGMHRAYQFIANYLKYPELARRESIQGKVFVQFVVDKDGSVTEVETIQGIGGGCDKEAERIVKMMKDWEPGYHGGEPVRVRMVLPITFSLGTSSLN